MRPRHGVRVVRVVRVVLGSGAALVLMGTGSACSRGGHSAGASVSPRTTVVSSTTPQESTAVAPGTVSGATGTTPSTRGPASSTTVAHGGGGGGGTGQTVSAASASGGLQVTFTVTPVRARDGASVGFSITATASHATGALGYQVTYGDGTSDQNVVPQFCTGGGGATSQASWTLTHRYAAAGTYRASVHVYVNCGVEKATTAPVTVGVS